MPDRTLLLAARTARAGNMFRAQSGCFLLFAACAMTFGAEPNLPALKPFVEAEEEVYSFEPANNGAGPMWCSGSTCLVRCGDNLLASGIQTMSQAKPLNNCRWLLFQRGQTG